MLGKITAIAVTGVLGILTNVMAQDIRKESLMVTSYASVLGRAKACDQDVSAEVTCIEKWMDTAFVGEERARQAMVFTNALNYNDSQQRKGISQVNCSEALKEFRRTQCGAMGPGVGKLPGHKKKALNNQYPGT